MAPGQVQHGVAPLPRGFSTVQDVLDGKIKLGSLAKVIGVVTDMRAPVATRGTDWKCQMSIYDFSCQWDHEESLVFNIFRPKEDMPDATVGDVVAIMDAKVQRYGTDGITMITSYPTDTLVFKGSLIPRPPADASKIAPQPKKSVHQLDKAAHEFISYMYHNIDKERLPTMMEFETKKLQSLNVKNKFSELKNVQNGKFYDLIVQFVKAPFDSGDKLTLWVSDYTENPDFFNHTVPLSGDDGIEAQGGDPYGYCAKFAKPGASKSAWTGPYGKRSLQVTCYEPHASVIRDANIGDGSWTLLKNIQIKYGSSGANLEGYLREDRGTHGVKINVTPLDPSEDPENIPPGLKEAIRRKRDYERLKKQQKKSLDEASKAGLKRKAALEQSEPKAPSNTRARRKSRRAKLAGNAVEDNAQPLPVPDLNDQVKCDHQATAASPVADIVSYTSVNTVDGEQSMTVQLPFVNLNYRAHVRVVNFLPSQLEDFCQVKKGNSEFDILSDNDHSDDDSEDEQDVASQPAEGGEWEWKFWLELEDAVVGTKQQKSRVWVFVDNQAAQCLVNLDASDLKQDSENLDALRQRMFLLWGDLEEHKKREAAKMLRQRHKEHAPPDSSDAEDRGGDANTNVKEDSTGQQYTNRPFSCCIRQYGVKVPESDASLADAGEGRRWERVYGLFGTKVSGV